MMKRPFAFAAAGMVLVLAASACGAAHKKAPQQKAAAKKAAVQIADQQRVHWQWLNDGAAIMTVQMDNGLNLVCVEDTSNFISEYSTHARTIGLSCNWPEYNTMVDEQGKSDTGTTQHAAPPKSPR